MVGSWVPVLAAVAMATPALAQQVEVRQCPSGALVAHGPLAPPPDCGLPQRRNDDAAPAPGLVCDLGNIRVWHTEDTAGERWHDAFVRKVARECNALIAGGR